MAVRLSHPSLGISLLLALSGGCSNSQLIALINVDALPVDVDGIYVCAKVPGQSGYHFSYMDRTKHGQWPTAELEVAGLPNDFTGTLTALFEARSANGCVLGTESATLDYGNGPPTHKLTLPAPLNGPVCKVTFASCGVGRGVPSFRSDKDNAAACPFDDDGVHSLQLSATYVPRDHELIFDALAGPNSHFADWVDRCPEESAEPNPQLEASFVSGAGSDIVKNPCHGQGARCKLDAVRSPLVIRGQFNLGLCTTPGFCWENPLPQGNDLHDVWGSKQPGGSVYAAGSSGTILRNDGQGWLSVPSGVTAALNGISGTAANDIWAVGEAGLILHYDGQSWQRAPGSNVSTESLRSIVALPAYVTAVGSGRALVQGALRDPLQPWNLANSKWAVLGANIGMTPTIFTRVVGATPAMLLAVADDHNLHVGGSAGWNISASEPIACGTQPLYGLWSSGTMNWAVGDNGAILRSDGTSCIAEVSGQTKNLRAVSGADSSLWAVGEGGLVLSRNGGNWQPIQPTNPASADLTGIWAQSPTEHWAVGVGGAIRHGNATTSPIDPSAQDPTRVARGQDPIYGTIRAVSGRDASSLWAVGDLGLIMHWDGLRWSQEDNPDDQGRTLNGVWVGPSEVWAVGEQGAVLQRDGSGWHLVQKPEDVRLWGVGATDGEIWVTGASGRVYALPRGSNTWSRRFPAASLKDYYAVWGSNDFVCVVSSAPVTETNVLCGRGTGTELVDVQFTPNKATMFAIWGTGPADVWAAGDGYVLHRTKDDPMAWQAIGPYPGESFRAIAGAGSGSTKSIWVSGTGGTVRRCLQAQNCTTLDPMAVGTSRDFFGLWGGTSGEVVLVGELGTILRSQL